MEIFELDSDLMDAPLARTVVRCDNDGIVISMHYVDWRHVPKPWPEYVSQHRLELLRTHWLTFDDDDAPNVVVVPDVHIYAHSRCSGADCAHNATVYKLIYQ